MSKDAQAHYVALSDQFIAHWTQVNTALGATPLVLRHGYGVANLRADRDTLETTLATHTSTENGALLLRQSRLTQQNALKERLKQFRNAVLSRMADTEFAAALPLVPSIRASQEIWRTTLDDMGNLWKRINENPPAGVTAPLKLADGYTLAQFTTDWTELKSTYIAVTEAESAVGTARITRKTQAAGIRKQLIAYRKAVVADLPTGHPLRATLPEL